MDIPKPEQTEFEAKVERFLEFRPAVRVLYYYLTEDGGVKVLVGKHTGNGRLTIPGGRFKAEDAKGFKEIRNALWHSTMFRELLEEIRIDDMSILYDMMENRFDYLGTVFWKHYKDGQICIDFLAAIKCNEMFDVIPGDNELEEMRWIEYNEEKDLFNNIDLALQLLISIVRPTIGPPPERTMFDEENEFTYEEIIKLVAEINYLINSGDETGDDSGANES